MKSTNFILLSTQYLRNVEGVQKQKIITVVYIYFSCCFRILQNDRVTLFICVIFQTQLSAIESVNCWRYVISILITHNITIRYVASMITNAKALIPNILEVILLLQLQLLFSIDLAAFVHIGAKWLFFTQPSVGILFLRIRRN